MAQYREYLIRKIRTMAVDLKKNKDALKAAYDDVLSSSSGTDW